MSTTYYFGSQDSAYSNIKIKAESLEEAKLEFAFSIDDISRCTVLRNPYFREASPAEPYGYKDGNILPDSIVPFYSRVPISVLDDGLKEVGEITSTEIALLLATPQQKLIGRITGAHEESKSKEIAPSKGMLMLHSQARVLQTDFRRQKRGLLALQSQAAIQQYANKKEFDRLQSEQRVLGEKINIMSVYAGMGKDVVKIRNGKGSDRKAIDIFQSFRFMREDIELLTDFENFDFSSMDGFDAFVAEHYETLLPSELCIQAFRISKFPILYKKENIFGSILEGDEENNKVFILVRNGENVYRFFNTYKLGDGLFSSTNDLAGVTAEIGKFDDFTRAKIDGSKPTGFWEIKGNTDDDYTYRTERIPSQYDWYPQLDTGLLDRLFESCKSAFEGEISRREAYIAGHNLEGRLDPYSWRWGMPYAQLKYHFFKLYHKTFERMHTKLAYDTNNYRLNAVLKQIRYALYWNTGSGGQDIYADIETAKEKRREGFGVLTYEDYRGSGSEREGQVQRFDPDTGAALYASIGRCDDDYMYDGFMGVATELFDKKRHEMLSKRHLENFHATAILQNIVDNKRLFPDFDGIDFIMGEGMEFINRVEDGGLLLTSSDDNTLDPETICNAILARAVSDAEPGMVVNVLRSYSIEYDWRLGVGNEKTVVSNEKSYGEELYRSLPCKIVGRSRMGVKVKGAFDVYTRRNWEKGIYPGSSKIVEKVIRFKENHYGASDILVPQALLDEEIQTIREVMRQRTFREAHYLTYGVFFKTLLKLHWGAAGAGVNTCEGVQ